MKIAMCDDDSAMGIQMRELISIFNIAYNQEIEFVYYSTAEELMQAPFDYQILLLDIMLEKGRDGIMVGRRLRKMGNQALFILCTSRIDRFQEGYEATVFRYLVKPLTRENFFTALKDALDHMATAARTFPIRYNKRADMVFLSQVIYIESYMRKRYVYTTNGKFQTTDTWENIRSELEGEYFYAPQRSYFINLAHVRSSTRKHVNMSNGAVINFSKGYYEGFNQLFNEFLENTR